MDHVSKTTNKPNVKVQHTATQKRKFVLVSAETHERLEMNAVAKRTTMSALVAELVATNLPVIPRPVYGS